MNGHQKGKEQHGLKKGTLVVLLVAAISLSLFIFSSRLMSAPSSPQGQIETLRDTGVGEVTFGVNPKEQPKAEPDATGGVVAFTVVKQLNKKR